MARSLGRQLLKGHFLSSKHPCIAPLLTQRSFGTSQCLLTNEDSDEKSGWFKNLLRVRTLAPSKESHSSQLSDKETVYEIQFHSVKPENMEEYLKQFSRFQELMHEKKTGANLVGSFTVEIGDQDEAIHIWEYKGGYPVLNNATEIYRTDQDFIDFRNSRNKMLRSRKNQILLAFSFWPEPKPREGRNIYEMRSYTLKPGTMIEWSNNWAKGIRYRMENEVAFCGLFTQIGDLYTVHHVWGKLDPARILLLARGIEHRRSNNEPVAGFFTHLGDQYVVHHLWGYSNLQTRKETREMAWSKPGWDECVAYTVPLIRHMQSRILIPTPFSPVQ